MFKSATSNHHEEGEAEAVVEEDNDEQRNHLGSVCMYVFVYWCGSFCGKSSCHFFVYSFEDMWNNSLSLLLSSSFILRMQYALAIVLVVVKVEKAMSSILKKAAKKNNLN